MDLLSERYRKVFMEEMGQLYKESNQPVTWFAHNYWDKLQWAAYIGECQGFNALACGINLEFRPAWRKVHPRLSVNAIAPLLEVLGEDEWHWLGRPGFLCRNPGIVNLYDTRLKVKQIDLSKWLYDLKDIMDNRVTWENGPKLMRPQLQIMRRVGDSSLTQDMEEVRHNIRVAMRDMKPVMDLFSGKG